MIYKGPALNASVAAAGAWQGAANWLMALPVILLTGPAAAHEV